MWLYSINSTNSVCPRGSSLASDNLYEVDSSPEGSSSSSTSDPYRLFAFPESHSPPTPYETTRQREAARRRQAKVKAGKRQLEQNELQTCDEACRITLFENELSENARQRQACWKPAGKSNAFRTKLSQDRLGGNGKLNKSVEKKNEGLKRKAQRVIAKRRVHGIHNVNQASKDKKKVYCEVEQKLLVNQEIRDLSLKRSSSNTACASLKENVRPTLTLGHQPSKAQDEKKLDQVVTSDNAHKLLLDSDGIDRIFDSVVVMPAMYSTKANSYKADGVFRGLSACAIRKSPLLINSTRRYDGINTTAKTKIRDNVSLFKKRTVNELNSGSTDAVISGNCSNFQLQSRALMNYSPELNTEVRIGNTEQYRSEVNGAEPLLLKHAASARQVTCDSRLKKPQQRRSQTSNNRFPREVWKGAAVRRERFAQLEGKRVKTERTVSITSIKNSNNQLSVLNKPNGRAIDGHSSDEDAKKTGTDECQSGYDQKEMARRRLVDECTQRDCYVVTARYEEPGGHTSFRHAHAATSTKVDTKQATKAVRDQAVKRSGDSGSVKGNLPKKSRTNAEMLGDSPIQILKVLPLVIPEYPVNFTYLLNSWDIEVVAKIGEGSFSEVFQVRKIEPSGDENTQTEYVIKVVPVGNHGQPKFDDLLPEMHMSLAGRDLQESDVNRAPTFIGLQGMHLVYGEFTDEMASACQIFATNFPDDAEHPLPSERPVDQYFIVFFTSYDGVELETILPKLTTEQKCSIVLQITLGLAAAEAAFDFEHRDLHLSNLVVSDYEINNNDTSNDDDGGCASIATTVSSDNNDHSSMIEFRVEGKSYWVNSFGKKIALIDYGMSRLVVDETLYTSFSSSILEGHNLQRKTYREQHKLVGGIGNYRTAMPETNGLWIKFLICKLFPKRPLNPNKAQYAIQVNQLYEALMLKPVCARNCLSLLAFNGNGGLPT
ncbi:uncharacterized protein LOC111262899 isoform X2 [Varroa jacobsoni]|uniref:uncharacterized protein LOC111262899 isoform X2 n=1 Tax=Varroa jacobsoni TaxID=62625 RepID=UPI000BFA1492|nr:uncharacterized protein LOC111262899 isoform X2 [Varroa jacobsoni]